MNVGEATVRRADRVRREDPETFERVKKGEGTVNAAHDNLKTKSGTAPAARRSQFISATKIGVDLRLAGARKNLC
jgi:hypothetical protein